MEFFLPLIVHDAYFNKFAILRVHLDSWKPFNWNEIAAILLLM